MNNFTALSYDQVIQKIKQHKPDIEPSIYLYQCLELDTIAPIFFFKSRVKREALTQNGIEWRYANFFGWAASYDRKLNDFFRIGYHPIAGDTMTISFYRFLLVHALRRFDWERIQTPNEDYEVKLYPPLPWHLADESEKFSISRAECRFWVTDASELNKSNQSDTATADTAYLATIGALLALLKNQSRKHTQDSLINEIQKMKDAEFPYARALSKSQLEDTFSAANKVFKDLKKQ